VKNDLPCRVSAETRAHLEEQAKNDQFGKRSFDPWDADLMIEICGGRFAEPMAELLIKLDQIDKTNGSFGADKERACDFLLPTLYKLRDACLKEFDEL
jgi:hypothetical protein